MKGSFSITIRAQVRPLHISLFQGLGMARRLNWGLQDLITVYFIAGKKHNTTRFKYTSILNYSL